MKTVSVVVTTHKRHSLLRETLLCLMAQTCSDLEGVIVDDAGESETREIVSQVDPGRRRLQWHNRSDVTARKGGQPSRNAGLALARGDFVLFLDDDDLLAPDCVSGRLEALLAEPRADACVGQCRQFVDVPSEDGPIWCPWSDGQDDLEMFLRSAVPWQTSGPLWRREALERSGPWNESLTTGWDYEFHIRALSRGVKFIRRDIVDYFWRAPRPDSYSGFDRMKADHRDGGHIRAFTIGVREVGANVAWTLQRRAAARREAVRLAVLCRLYGGTLDTALQAIDVVRAQGCITGLEYVELRFVLASWGTVGGKIPALAWLRRRGFTTREVQTGALHR